jgi:hypothetical protein
MAIDHLWNAEQLGPEHVPSQMARAAIGGCVEQSLPLHAARIIARQLEAFYLHARAHLPAYAVPFFVRIGAVGLTETFKHRKQDLVRQGFDPSQSNDALFARLSTDDFYRKLDNALHASICSGETRL